MEFIRQVPRRHRRFSTKFATKASESTSLGRSLFHGINSPEIDLNFSLTCLASCESMSRLVFILTFLSAIAAPSSEIIRRGLEVGFHNPKTGRTKVGTKMQDLARRSAP